MRAVGIEIFLWRAGDVNPLIDRVDTAKIRGLTSPARRTQLHRFFINDNSWKSEEIQGKDCGLGRHYCDILRQQGETESHLRHAYGVPSIIWV